MALQLGDSAPNFTAETTAGSIDFHEWLGDSWGVLFSHSRSRSICAANCSSGTKMERR